MSQSSFQVRRDDYRKTRFVSDPFALEAARGELALRVDRFALTANNVTYALYGDALGYWQFYPAPEGWGILPCWGFAEVIASGVPEVQIGERLFGYWPMARFARLTPERVDAGVVYEGAARRQALHPFYNRYARQPAGAAQSAEAEGWQAHFAVLGATGFVLDDLVAANAAWGARRVVLSSASSKTAVAGAHFLRQRGLVEVVGITSAAHRDYVASTGAYDHVACYDDIEALAVAPSIYVDIAGDFAVKRRVHARLGDALKKSFIVGGTHWSATAPGPGLTGPVPELFFAPELLRARLAEWGEAELQRRLDAAMQGLMPVVTGTMKQVFAEGPAALEAAYIALLDGAIPPDEARVLRV